MLSETIKLGLAERYAVPLPAFYSRRIVFWHDGKPFWKVGIACFDKQCRVKCEIPYISYPFFL